MTTGSTPPDHAPPADELDDGDLEDRVPCPDGACIGVIGPDGRCTECGRAADRDGASEDLDDEDDELWDEGDGELADGGGDEEERTPCPDGACIGIIGPDGRCSECGRAADPGAGDEEEREP